MYSEFAWLGIVTLSLNQHHKNLQESLVAFAPGDTSPFLNIKNQSYMHPEPVVQFLAPKMCTMKRVNVHLFAKPAMRFLSLMAGYLIFFITGLVGLNFFFFEI